MLNNLLSQDYYDSLLSEFPQLSIYDLKRCINISITEYFDAKHAFIVKDKIYVIQRNNIQELQKNSIRTKLLKQIIGKNFRLISIFKNSNIQTKFIKQNNIVIYGKIDTINQEFALFSLYFNRKPIANIKMISYKNNENSLNFDNLSTENIYPIQLNMNNLQKIEDIFIFNGDIINRNIIVHYLSLIFKKLNKKLIKKTNQKIFYNIKSINYSKNILILTLNIPISRMLLNLIELKVREKFYFHVSFDSLKN